MSRFIALVGVPDPDKANIFNNLANLLVNEGRANRAPASRRASARGYAERALAIKETLEISVRELIAAIAAAAQGDAQMRALVEEEFPKMEAGDWGNVPPVIRRIWAGERDWHTLYQE